MRRSRDSRPYDPDEIIERRSHSEDNVFLREMLETPGWVEVARTSLRVQVEVLKDRIAHDSRMTPEAWRHAQSEVALLERMLKDPFQFFSIPR